MKRYGKRTMALILSFVLLFSSLQISSQAKGEDGYTIYPTVQEIKYDGKSITLTEKVDITYGSGIDKYTVSHVEDVLAILNMKAEDTASNGDENTKLYVGIYGSGDAADTYFQEKNMANDSKFFEKYDAYLLSIQDNVIAILGKDTDAAFCGVTTLKHIFNQVEKREVKSLLIQDYADVKSRGFIEGYYGEPWSNEDRADLMTFGGDYKLNQYIYAPKDDPKHNSEWRSLYTQEELDAIGKLAEAGNYSKCYYVYALHPFMTDAIQFDTEEHYQADLTIIKTKFEQLMSVGVKQFAILADDASVPSQGASSYVKLMTDLTNWLIEKQAEYEGLKSDMLFCPADYYGDGSSSDMQAIKTMPESVSIIQTGGRIWGAVETSFNETFKKNMGRAAYMWINWPCSDNTKDGLIMGGAETVLKPGVDPSTIAGIVLNPMQQSEPSKEALFTNADYAWNIWESADQYEQVWYDSFNYMDHGTAKDTVASEALRELSKHMMNSTQLYNEESADIKDLLSSFIADFSAGNSIQDSANELIAEFETLQKAASDYRNHAGNTRTRDQIVYWLDCWDDTTSAILSYLKAAIAIEEDEDSTVIWNAYAAGKSAMASSKTHTFYYVSDYVAACVGRKYITPFMEELEELLSVKVSTIVDPTKQVETFITNRTDTPTGEKTNALDNNESTEVIFKTPSSIAEGTYVGISYTKAISVEKVVFKLGQSGNSNDTFQKAKVQYTQDGKTWVDIDGAEYDTPKTVTLENLGLKNVKGIRMIATQAKSNTWLGVKDILVNPEEEEEAEEEDYPASITVSNLSVKDGSLDNVIDSDSGSYAHFAEGNYKGDEYMDYIPVDAQIILTYENAKTLGTIHFKQDSGTDKITKYAIEYSEDGSNWVSLGEYNGDSEVTLDVSKEGYRAKAVRIRNLELNLQESANYGYWWKVYDFSVSSGSESTLNPTFSYTDRWSIYDGSISNLTDGSASTALDFNTNSSAQAGDYICWDMGKVIAIGEVTAVIGGDRASGDKFVKYALEYSDNGTDWTTYQTYSGNTNAKDYIEEDFQGQTARYVRIRNLEDRSVWVIFSEFTVSPFDTEGGYTSEHVYTNTDLDLRVKYAEDESILISKEKVTLKKNEYIGVDLGRIKDLESVNRGAETEGLTLQISKNGVDWTTLKEGEAPADARYVRLINLNEEKVSFSLSSLKVTSNEVTTPSLYETTMGINSSWGVNEDTRNNGAAFDGDVTTTTEFGDLPQKGQYIIYDLGQTRSVEKITLYAQDSAYNYIRDAEILISDDLEHWTKVVTIGDGVENQNDANVKCIDSDAGYKSSSQYPNKVYVEGSISATQARYLKIEMTASNNNRAVIFNEIVINDGEYVPVSNNPTFEGSCIEKEGYAPENMFDGNLSTEYRPDTTKAGYIQYTFSEQLDSNRLNIVQTGISNATVLLYVEKDGKREWVNAGTLSDSLNEITFDVDLVLEMKITWEDGCAPSIAEVVAFQEETLTEVKANLEKYGSSLEAGDAYTASTRKEFEAKKEEALSLSKDMFASVKQCNAAYQALEKAFEGLVKKGDPAAIKDQLDQIAQLDQTLYTAASIERLKAAVSVANTLLEGDDYTAEDVTTTARQLEEAQLLLVKKTEETPTTPAEPTTPTVPTTPSTSTESTTSTAAATNTSDNSQVSTGNQTTSGSQTVLGSQTASDSQAAEEVAADNEAGENDAGEKEASDTAAKDTAASDESSSNADDSQKAGPSAGEMILLALAMLAIILLIIWILIVKKIREEKRNR